MKLLIINGPNLNLLGKRQRDIYGRQTFEDFLHELRAKYNDYRIDYFQSNKEGEIIDKIHEFGFSDVGIILNAGGYTHTSVAISDAILSVECPVVEVHITNILARESYRQKSILSKNCVGSIIGFGLDSYKLAIESLVLLKEKLT